MREKQPSDLVRHIVIVLGLLRTEGFAEGVDDEETGSGLFQRGDETLLEDGVVKPSWVPVDDHASVQDFKEFLDRGVLRQQVVFDKPPQDPDRKVAMPLRNEEDHRRLGYLGPKPGTAESHRQSQVDSQPGLTQGEIGYKRTHTPRRDTTLHEVRPLHRDVVGRQLSEEGCPGLVPREPPSFTRWCVPSE